MAFSTRKTVSDFKSTNKSKQPLKKAGEIVKKRVEATIGKPAWEPTGGERGLGIVIYGPVGCGKTSMAAHSPNVHFMIDSQEDGILNLVRFKQCPRPSSVEQPENWEETLETLDSLSGSDIEWLAIDSLTGFERYCFQAYCKEFYDNNWIEFYNYSNGPKQAAKRYWPEFLSRLNKLRSRGVNILLLAHAKVREFKDPARPNYDQWQLWLDSETAGAIKAWAGSLIFYEYHVEVEMGKGISKNKAKASDTRFLNPVYSPVAEAKNQFGLDSAIDAGSNGKEAWEAFSKAVFQER